MELILVMPAYNEEGCIENVIRAWRDELCQTVGTGLFRMIVVNDGSRDRTGMILDQIQPSIPELQVHHQKNSGHGVAVLTAYEIAANAKPRWIFQVDSDDQFPPSEFRKLWEKRDSADFLLGNRVHRDDPFHRKIITRILRFFLMLVFGKFFADSNVPFRLIRLEVLIAFLKTLPSDPVFAPNIFLSLFASQNAGTTARPGIRSLQIPIIHQARKTGKISIVRWNLIRACLRCVRELWSYRCKT